MNRGDLYWQKTKRLTIVLLLFWALVTFGLTWFARELNELSLFGFPLGFYSAAQGMLLIYLGIIWLYNRWMRKLDAYYQADQE